MLEYLKKNNNTGCSMAWLARIFQGTHEATDCAVAWASSETAVGERNIARIGGGEAGSPDTAVTAAIHMKTHRKINHIFASAAHG
jgi:hypothetical protein